MLKKSKSLAIRCIFGFLAVFMVVLPHTLSAYKTSDFNWIPPFLARDEKPSIIIILDNSGSMMQRAYEVRNADNTYNAAKSAFNSSREYYGYFDPRTYYSYNDTPSFTNEYFYPDNATGEWNGNWLNWATMHRVDVARKVLGGGEYSSGIYRIESQDGSNRVSTFAYDASQLETDLNGNTRRMIPFTVTLNNNDHLINAATLRIRRTSTSTIYDYNMRVQGPAREGVLHAFKDKARMALFRYDADGDNHNGGTAVVSMSENATNLNNLINAVNTINPETWTPLAETLHTVYGYIQQTSTVTTNGPRYESDSYDVSTTADPFYFPQFGIDVPCTQQNVILITDGESTKDEAIPTSLRNLVNPKPTANYNLQDDGTSYLIDVAYWGQTTDLRSDLAGKQKVDFYSVFAFGRGSNLLKDAARYGKFKQTGPASETNGNLLPDMTSEYDADNDGMPDNYFEAESGQELEAAIFQAFQLATANIASGTAAAVTSQTRSGEGAAYQALFFPPTSAGQIAPPWSGQVHAFLLDARGNMREDTNGNGRLDLVADKVVQFDGDYVFVSVDSNGDMYINATERNINPLGSINEVNFLWSTSPWLNAISNSSIVTQRSYNSTSANRYIFTFVDTNDNMVPDSGEVQPFTHVTSDCNHVDNFCSYLTLYGNNTGAVAPAAGLSVSQLSAFSQRQINFIRGADIGNATNVGGSTLHDIVRSRTFNGSPWRLGDIIYSSPTVVGKPAENYHLIYQDKTYEAFFNMYKNRRQMIYAGGNDGMLHAFNGGFYNATSLNSTSRGSFQLTTDNGEAAHPLGAELWAYVPYNLLPHLKWLMDNDYGENRHAAYVDLKPRIFDARVFFQADGITPMNNNTHPGGWGTILVTGMRLGGAEIGIDINKDGTADRTASSAYVVMDITNPEQPPTLLGEIRMPRQGFTTCYPTVMPMSARNANTATDNQWYLVFGSGPASSTGAATRLKIEDNTSDQAGQLFVVDLKALVSQNTLKSINSSKTLVTGGSTFATTEPGSFVSDPIAVDLDIGPYASPEEFKTDVVYYGTVAGDQIHGQGTLRRLLTSNSLSHSPWVGNSTLINVGKPVTSGPSVALDDSNPQRLWVYFGTGRFFHRNDIPQNAPMAFYGVKEPIHSNGTKTWATVTGSLYNSTDVVLDNSACVGVNNQDCVKVFKGGSLITGGSAPGSWQNLTDAVALAPGWRLDFTPAYERVLGQAAVLGGAVLFTSYTPSNNVCSFEGTSKLWALYYKTGTAFYRPILGVSGSTLLTSVDLGQGMALTPNLHVGEAGSTAFIQSSTGAIQTIKVENPESVRSGTLFWRKNVE